MKYIGIVGSRRRDAYKDCQLVKDALVKLYEPGDVLVSGGCSRGGDRFAEMFARLYSIPIIIYPAEWKKYGRGAGFIRNTDIAMKADELIACVASDRTGGTEDTIKKFEKRGKVAIIVR
jgi:hypothetical protein